MFDAADACLREGLGIDANDTCVDNVDANSDIASDNNVSDADVSDAGNADMIFCLFRDDRSPSASQS